MPVNRDLSEISGLPRSTQSDNCHSNHVLPAEGIVGRERIYVSNKWDRKLNIMDFNNQTVLEQKWGKSLLYQHFFDFCLEYKVCIKKGQTQLPSHNSLIMSISDDDSFPIERPITL